MQRLYPKGIEFEERYPLFYKYKLLKVFLPFYRLLLALMNSPKRIWVELTSLLKK